jgi:hypothetical protein
MGETSPVAGRFYPKHPSVRSSSFGMPLLNELFFPAWSYHHPLKSAYLMNNQKVVMRLIICLYESDCQAAGGKKGINLFIPLFFAKVYY